MSGREHIGPWDVSDAEWDDRRDDPPVRRLNNPVVYNAADVRTGNRRARREVIHNLEDQINDLAKQLLKPGLTPEMKHDIRAQGSALRAMCMLLES